MKKKINCIRIQSGSLKNSKINFSCNHNIRPTKLILKKSLFSVLKDKIKDSFCLDLFSGSGSLGIESISRGAYFVLFNDKKYKNIRNIRKNLKRLKVKKNNYLTVNSDYKEIIKIKFLYDIIYIDPPFNISNKTENIINLFSKKLKKNGIIYLETNKIIDKKKISSRLIKIGSKGKVLYYIFYKSQ
ncbi:RsmD family RNA methyltransferase [Candidatus Vidania fulgoroideorum]